MPSETPTAPMRNMAASASWAVAASRSVTTRRAGARYWKDWPKSPRNTLRMKIPYWTWSGSRRPRCRFSSSTADWGAPSGSNILAGSPGRTRSTTNTRTETPRSVRAAWPSRRRTYALSPAPGYTIATSLSRT